MSMKQIEPYVRPCPLASNLQQAQAPFIYYFLYDNYYDCQDFERRFPRAVKLALGYIQGWVWHINANGTLPASDIASTANRYRETKRPEDVL
jgi:hypothetical protein